LYPSEITIKSGLDSLVTTLIREKSPIKRVYCKECYTPLFTIGGSSAMVNTNLIPAEERADVRFRIIGRNALKGENRPKMSWSVPLSFPFVMLKRVNKEKMTPLPLDVENPTVLENFHQG
jgi:hypothetical protein